jgi:hypothetical protein
MAAVALVAGTVTLYATRSTAPPVPDAIASRVSPPAMQPAASQTPAQPLLSAAPLGAPAPSTVEGAVSSNPRNTNALRVSRQPVTGVARELPSTRPSTRPSAGMDPDFGAMRRSRGCQLEAEGR